MLSILKKKLQQFWNAGHERSQKIKHNVIYTFLIKGASILISFWLVRVTIDYISPLQYGIWITIYSMVVWINNFDIGLGNGLRNQLAHALAVNDEENIKPAVSTTYVMLLLLVLVLFILFALIGSLFNWNDILNLNGAISYNIWPVLLITLGGYCVQFALQPINSILIATHQSFKSSILAFSAQALAFICILTLKHFTTGSLFWLVTISMWGPVLIYIIAHIYLFSTSLKNFRPAFRYVDRRMVRSLFSTGGSFFIIQIGTLVLYETDNIIITRLMGPVSVTPFNIAYKYFSILIVTFTIIITPFWSAFTDAYAKHDFAWIKNTLKKMRLMWLLFAAAAIILYLFAGIFYRIWIGKSEIAISALLSFSTAMYMVILIWNDMHAYLLNGTGKLRVQLILCVIGAVLNIPLAIWLVGKIGLPGTILSNFVVLLVMNLFFTYQCNLIANNKATGIWNK